MPNQDLTFSLYFEFNREQASIEIPDCHPFFFAAIHNNEANCGIIKGAYSQCFQISISISISFAE